MAAEIEMIDETTDAFVNGVNGLTGLAHKTFLAGLGAAALIQDEFLKIYENGTDYAVELSNRLVERGGELEKDGRDFINSRRNVSTKNVKGAVKDAETSFDRVTERVLGSLNLPTASDIQTLTKKVDGLNRKLNQIKKEQAKA